jgi:hypothetical protein
MSKKKPPCIRNLSSFKKGCPQTLWDGEEGCPCWIEMTFPKKDNPKETEILKHCVDIWMFIMQRDALGLLEGNQAAIESFRNGMTFAAGDGKTYPRANPASVELLKIFEQMKNQIVIPTDITNKKMIDNES